MNSREAIFLSYLAYHNKTELDVLNNGGTLKDGTDPIWIELWDKLKENYNHFSVFDCVDYDIGDTQFIYSTDKLDRLLISFRGTKCLNDLLTD